MQFGESASHISQLVRQKKISAREAVQFHLDQIEKKNKSINAVISVNETCLDEADAVVDRYPQGTLLGVPILIKDNICVEKLRVTAASKMLSDFTSPYSATLVDLLKKQGAIVIGKTNLDEFAMGSSNETSFYGPCKNPWDQNFVPGGSSGGSAAAVACGMAPISIGTDTGGSIRQPASYCGVLGLKPTYGRVSRFGLIAFASSLDQAGPLSRNTKDLALTYSAMSAFDPRDSTSSNKVVTPWKPSDVKNKKVGIIKEFSNDLDDEVSTLLQQQLTSLKQAGCEVVEVSLPMIDRAIAIYYLIATSEASSNLSRYDGVRYGHRANFDERPARNLAEFYQRNRTEGFGDEVKRRLMLGAYALSSGYYDAYYKKASQLRRILRDQLVASFDSVDVLLTPTVASLPFKIGEKIDDPIQMFMNDKLTTFANLSGLPSINVPVGFSKTGLPIGMQFTANHFCENTLFDFSDFFERCHPELNRVI